MTWAQRLKRVFNIDIETCSGCGGAMKVIACIEDPIVIKQILDHLKHKAETSGTRALPESRAPPANDTNQNAAFTAPRQGSAVLVVGKGAASGKEEGKFSALLAPRQPDWVASQGCRKSQLRSKAVGLG
ncbi:putative transposase [Klebsiella pneumoniae]|nr:putative transposase [Klebsiella pneumoniae]